MANNSPIAHEGNPKTDSITIAGGEVLSTATLGVVSPFVPAIPPGDDGATVPPPQPMTCAGDLVTEIRTVGGCPNSSIVDMYMSNSYAAVAKLNGSQPGCGNTGASQLAVDALDITVSSNYNINPDGLHFSTPKAGMSIWNAVTPGLDTPTFSETIATYEGPVSGSPISGLAMTVSADSTPCDFTGVVFLVDEVNARSILGYYVHQNLSTEMPTIIATGQLLDPGICIYFDWDPAYLEVAIAFGGGSFAQLSADFTTNPGVIPLTKNVGFIWVGVSNAFGQYAARWTRCSNWFVS